MKGTQVPARDLYGSHVASGDGHLPKTAGTFGYAVGLARRGDGRGTGPCCTQIPDGPEAGE